MLRFAVLGCILVSLVHSLPQYRDRILNGHNVPNPCCPGRTWDRVGHASTTGTQLNRFGSDFAANGHRFTEQLCLADSDGDGARNGQELGLITTQYNLETLCRFLVEYNMNPRAINFLQYRGLLGNANSHPGICDQTGPMSNCRPPPNCGC